MIRNKRSEFTEGGILPEDLKFEHAFDNIMERIGRLNSIPSNPVLKKLNQATNLQP